MRSCRIPALFQFATCTFQSFRDRGVQPFELPLISLEAFHGTPFANLVGRAKAQTIMLGKPIIALFAIIFLDGIHPSQWLTRMAIAASPSAYTMGVFGSGSASPSTRDLVLSFIAVGVELALFILIPIYVRSRQRAKIRSSIRILYDSRFEPALTMRVAQTPTASRLLRPNKSSRRPVREIGPSGIGW